MTNQRAIVLLSQMYLPAFDEEEKDAITKAIEALTALEPRLLTKADLVNNPNTDNAGVFPAYWEDRNYPSNCGWTYVSKIIDLSWIKDGRFWTSKPSLKQMEETPWE